VKLCDALSATHQQHVVREYMTRDAFRAADQSAVSAADLNRAVVSTKYSLQGSVVDSWRTVLVQNRSAIIDALDSSDDFINGLVKYGVMNFATGELCRVNHRSLPCFVYRL